MSFWSLSCLPGTNISTYPRFFCLNINGMEIFVCGYEKGSGAFFAFLVVNSIDKKDSLILEQKYNIKTINSFYKIAGNDQITLNFDDILALKTFLADENETEVRRAIKGMNLRLMRKGGTIFSKFHCFDLVKDVLK